MNIALWKGVADYFEIEIINLMTDTSHKFAVNNTDIKIQEGVLFVTVCTTFEQQCAVIYIYCNVTKIHQNLLYRYHPNICNYMKAISPLHSQF